MTDNIVFRAVLLGFMGLGVMLVLGVITVALLSMDNQVEQPSSLSGFEGFQIVDQACVQQMKELKLEASRLSKELEAKRKHIEDAKAMRRNQMGEPVSVPKEVPAHQQPSVFEAAANQAVEKQKRISLLAVECGEYPCIAVFEGTSEGFLSRLSGAFREAGFSWSSRRVVEGVSSHEEGARYFAAIRFYPKDDLEPPQERYLERGLDAALVKGMDVLSIEPSDK